MNYCHARMSFLNRHWTQRRASRGSPHTNRGFVSRARLETKKGVKHGKAARREGYRCVVDRYIKDEMHRNCMVVNGVDYEAMQEWDRMFFERETTPGPIHGIPYELRKRKYAPWGSRSTTIGGIDTLPHSWGQDDIRAKPATTTRAALSRTNGVGRVRGRSGPSPTKRGTTPAIR